MRYLIAAMIVLFTAAVTHAGDNVPYGDYSGMHSAYGISKANLKPKEAEAAIERYFAGKGLRALNMRHKGRFIEADIYRGSAPFDKILFDRKTGRIRSTY